uniref:Uncharacterized protein n=1 Tax=Chenopodium quinoa TaxID=63459 RepID=A0A803LJ36_CHEQI
MACNQVFVSKISAVTCVEIANVSDTIKAYKLQDTLQSRPATKNLLPLLGRSIIEGSVIWGSAVLKMYGESCFILSYREWTEDVLCRSRENLKSASIYNAVYASLYSYDKNPHILRAL